MSQEMKLSETAGYAASQTAKAAYDAALAANGALDAATVAAKVTFCDSRNVCYEEMGVPYRMGQCA